MRWYNKLRLVFRAYSRRIFVTLMIFAMCLVCFYMTDKVLTDYISSRYDIGKAENQLGCNPENGFYVQLYEENRNAEDTEIIKNFLKGHEAVVGAGCTRDGALMRADNSIYCSLWVCDKDVMSLGNLKLDESQLDIINNADGDMVPVFLGNDYKGKVDVGTVFKVGDPLLFTDVYVAGFLKKDAAWPHLNGLFSGSFGELDSYDLNAGAVLVTDDVHNYYSEQYYMVYCVTKDGCYDQVREDLLRFAVENNLNVKIVNYGEDIENEKEERNIMDDNTLTAAVMLAVLAVASITVATIIYCLMNKGQYGIMIANGLTKGNIIWIITVQNVITVTIAAVAAWFIRNKELFSGNDMSKAELIKYKEVLYKQLYVAHDCYMPIILFAACVLILIAATIIPAYIIRKTSLTEMLSQHS